MSIWLVFDGHLNPPVSALYRKSNNNKICEIKCESNASQQIRIKSQSNMGMARIWLAFDLAVLTVFGGAFTRTATHDFHGAQPFSSSSVSSTGTSTVPLGHRQTNNPSFAMKVGVPDAKIEVPRGKNSAMRHVASHGIFSTRHRSQRPISFVCVICVPHSDATNGLHVLSWRRPYNRYYSCLTCFW